MGDIHNYKKKVEWNVPKRGHAKHSSLSDGDKGLILEFVSHKIARGIGGSEKK